MSLYSSGDTLQWKPLTLTHVMYPKDDLYGKFLALFSLVPFAIVVAFFTLTLFIRDIHVISFFIGQVGNELLNKNLKTKFEEGRPQQIAGQPNIVKSFGWPSSHCQFIGFFLVYSSLCIFARLRHSRSKLFCLLLMALNFVTLFFIVHSRTYLRYHFLHQCIHGLMIGGSVAIVWFLTILYVIEPFVWEPILKSSFNQKFLNLCSIYLPRNRQNQSGRNKSKSNDSNRSSNKSRKNN